MPASGIKALEAARGSFRWPLPSVDEGGKGFNPPSGSNLPVKARRNRLRAVSPADLVTLGAGGAGAAAIYLLAVPRDIPAGSALILLAMLLDGLDGAVARRFGSKHHYGQVLDSISDSVSFCFAPAVLLQATYLASAPFLLLALASILVASLGVLRLIRFTLWGHKLPTFSGLPTPATALLLTTLVALFADRWWITVGFALVAAILMVSPVPYPKLRGRKGAAFAAVVALGLVGAALGRLAGSSEGQAIGDLLLIASLGLILAYLVVGPVYGRRINEAWMALHPAEGRDGARADGGPRPS